ncbi:MAG: hypothetical protein ABFS30_18185 [Pseudomonadota bacterium]
MGLPLGAADPGVKQAHDHEYPRRFFAAAGRDQAPYLRQFSPLRFGDFGRANPAPRHRQVVFSAHLKIGVPVLHGPFQVAQSPHLGQSFPFVGAHGKVFAISF